MTSDGQRMPDKSRLQAVVCGSHWDSPDNAHPSLSAIDRGVGMSDQELFSQRGSMLCGAFMGGRGSKAGGIGYHTEVSPSVKSVASGTNTVPDVVCFHGSQDTITNETHANAIGRNGGLENCVLRYDARGNGDGETANTITGDHSNRVTDYTPLVQNAVAISANIIGRKPENGGHQLGVGGDVAFTQDTCCVMGVSYRQTVRRLTPVECERLMGFPDNHTLLFAWKGKNVAGKCPDGPRYKACGNSMCVNCMEWIGRQIQNEMEKP